MHAQRDGMHCSTVHEVLPVHLTSREGQLTEVFCCEQRLRCDALTSFDAP